MLLFLLKWRCFYDLSSVDNVLKFFYCDRCDFDDPLLLELSLSICFLYFAINN